MKCEICGIETPDYAGSAITTIDLHTGKMIRHDDPSGLRVDTNFPCKNEDFFAIFGFWDHRSKKAFEICGSCIAETFRGFFLRTNPVVATVGSVLSGEINCSGISEWPTSGAAFAAPEVPPDPTVVVPKK